MGAAADCELITQGLFGQPVNSLTTLAFIAAGVIVARDSRLKWIGIALAATGVGSFLFHGPMSLGSEWAHDVSLAWLVLAIAGLGSRWERWTWLPGLAFLSVMFALLPGMADPAAVALTIAALIVIVRRDVSTANLAPLVLLGAVAILGRLGSTSGPLCNPASLWQWHGLWHIGAATAVVWWAVAWSGRSRSIYPS